MPPSPHTAYDAVIFDLDGTLVDTESLCNETGVAACATLGHPVSLAFFEALAGIDDHTRIDRIRAESGQPVDTDAFLAEWDRLCTLRYARGISLKPDVPELLDQIRALGLPMGICTSSRSGPARAKIDAAGFGGYFDTVVTFDDVARAKPAPDPYLLSARRLGATPSRCLAFEDSNTGAASARAAGMVVVQVPDLTAPSGDAAHHLGTRLGQGAVLAGLIPG